MGMDNKTVARILRETAELLQIDGAIIGRYRSYEKTAELIAGMHESIEQIAQDPAKLTELPGIGDRMAEHIQEILKTGDYGLRAKLLKKFPPTLLEVIRLQSLGPKKVAFLWSTFKAATVADVERLASCATCRDSARRRNRIFYGRWRRTSGRQVDSAPTPSNRWRTKSSRISRNLARAWRRLLQRVRCGAARRLSAIWTFC
jgi:DNA polymerase/3'-5' exonuclease PolX